MAARPMVPVQVQAVADATNNILDLPTLKAQLKLTGSSQDIRLNRIIRAVEVGLETYLRRPVRKRERLHYFDAAPDCDRELYLKETPIISVDAIEARNNNAWTAIANTEYNVFRTWDDVAPPVSETIIQPTEEWDFDVDDGYDPVRVKTTSGWDTIPGVIEDVAYRMAQDRFVSGGTVSDVRQYRFSADVREALDAYMLPFTVRFF